MVTVPFATLDELKARWPDIPPGAESYAETLLEDASQFMLDVVPTAGVASLETRRRVVCSVVRRAMQADQSSMMGLSQAAWSDGPFSGSATPANPHGDFYLTKQEKVALGGGGRQKAFGVQLASAPSLQHVPWCSLMLGAAYCSCGADLTLGDPLWEA